MIKRLALFALLACYAGFAQTTTFTANTKDLATVLPATPEAGPVYLELTLRNCAGSGTTPTIPHVNGTGLVVFPVNLYPDNTGAISKTVYDQTFIVCGSSAGVGYYHIRVYQGDNTRSLVKKLLFEDDFDVQGASFNLNSATPRSGSVISPPVATAVLTNPAGNQTIVQPVGTALSINHLSAGFSQNANGAKMIPASRFTDTAPTGDFLDFTNASGASHLWEVDVTGSLINGIIPSARLSNTVTPATQTKITYNGQGLVTAGAQAAASDLSNGTTGAGKIGLQAVNTVTFSATPTFDCSLGSVQKLTLTANVTSSSLANCQAGQIVTFEICQDGTGGRTFVNPAGLNQWSAIPSAASACGSQQYSFDTTTTAFPDMMPALSGDVTSSATSTVTTVAKVNGVSYPASPSTHAVPVTTAANTETYKVVPDCTDTTGNHINYTQSTDAWSCGTSVPANTVTLTGVQAPTNKTFTGASTGNNVSVLNAQGATTAITGTGADAVLYTYSLPANTIDTTSKAVKVSCAATHNSGTANPSVKININGVNAVTGNIGTTASQSTNFEALILRTSTTAGGSKGVATVSGALNPFSVTLAGLAWTSAQTITCTFNVAATDQMTGVMFLVEQVQ